MKTWTRLYYRVFNDLCIALQTVSFYIFIENATRPRKILLANWWLRHNYNTNFRVCLHGGGGLQIGEVTCGEPPYLSCKRDQIKMRDYMDRRVTRTWAGYLTYLLPPPHIHVNRPLVFQHLDSTLFSWDSKRSLHKQRSAWMIQTFERWSILEYFAFGFCILSRSTSVNDYTGRWLEIEGIQLLPQK